MSYASAYECSQWSEITVLGVGAMLPANPGRTTKCVCTVAVLIVNLQQSSVIINQGALNPELLMTPCQGQA